MKRSLKPKYKMTREPCPLWIEETESTFVVTNRNGRVLQRTDSEAIARSFCLQMARRYMPPPVEAVELQSIREYHHARAAGVEIERQHD